MWRHGSQTSTEDLLGSNSIQVRCRNKPLPTALVTCIRHLLRTKAGKSEVPRWDRWSGETWVILLSLVLWNTERRYKNGDTTLSQECGHVQLMCCFDAIVKKKWKKKYLYPGKRHSYLVFECGLVNTTGMEAATTIWYLPYPSSQKFQENFIYEFWSNQPASFEHIKTYIWV